MVAGRKINAFFQGAYKPHWREIPLLTSSLVLTYVACGVLVNLFAHLLPVYRLHNPLSGDPVATFPIIPGTLLVGLIFVLRDYTQQLIGDYVIGLTLLASAIVCVLIDGRLGLYSGAAFLVSEGIDQLVWKWLGKEDIKDRILWSSAASTWLDGVLILQGLNELTWSNFTSHYIGKMLSVFVIWLVLRHNHKKKTLLGRA